MRGRAIAAALTVAGFGAATILLAQGVGKDDIRLRADDPDEVALGREVYAAQCAACHGAALEGQPDWQSPGPDGILPAPPHDETGHSWHHPDAMLFTLTRDGAKAILGPDTRFKSGMPAFAGVLSDTEIRAALSFIKSTWPEDIRAMHDEINARSADR